MTKRAYKLQEFVAHSSNVNCLTIGKKSSRVLVTGGEDQKVNMWAIGKPNAILSLAGHTSAVESVTFDAAEVLVVAGAASGTIKLWDLEEAKIVRTLTGHRSNCVSVSFHPFGEFFASGSLDTNLKIWDIRRKGCIHTYKGHTRGINTIKFSPDGRWVVSGGEDNSVKLWDLTAGKLMHDFKLHEGQIQSLDFHPHEFLLATGSADRTVKFWDLETFELIGSAGPEQATGVRAMTFNPDGRTLLTAMHDSLKVLSWEPIRCHDVVDVGWSKLADLSVHEGKLIGCSFQQSCVGVWVVDLMRVSPFQAGHASRAGTVVPGKVNTNGHQVNQHSTQKNNGLKGGIPDILEPSLSSSMREMTLATAKISDNLQHLSTKPTVSVSSKSNLATSSPVHSSQTPRKMSSARLYGGSVVRSSSRSDVLAISSSMSSLDLDRHVHPAPTGSEDSSSTRSSGGLVSLRERSDQRSLEGLRGDAGADAMRIDTSSNADVTSSSHRNIANGDKGSHDGSTLSGPHRSSDNGDDLSYDDLRKFKRSSSFAAHRSDSLHKGYGPPLSHSNDVMPPQASSRPASSVEASTTGRVEATRMQGLIAQFDRKERHDGAQTQRQSTNGGVKPLGLDFNSFAPRGSQMSVETSGSLLVSDEELIETLMQQHHTMTSIMQSRLTNMQVVRRFWMKNDVKGAMEAMAKLADHSVLVDVLNVVMERSSVLSLEVTGLLLPLLNELLCSHNERHILTAITLVHKLVKTFGQTIHAAISANSSLGVDLQAEQRLERCKVCHQELQQVSRSLVPLTRGGGEVSKAAQDLSVVLKEILES
ncbi:unnamed protein product [Calypogeia fissa]